MFKVNKKEEPKFFESYKKKNKPTKWSDYDYKIKEDLKKYMLQEEQNFFCPYCELSINLKNSQIEHIKPKDKFPKELNNYNNYLTGCINPKTCGQHKGNNWSDKFINPTLENPEDYLTYDIMTGEIVPIENDGEKFEKAKETIKILNLNDKRLCQIRKTFIIVNKNSNFQDINNYLQFPTLRKYLEKYIKIFKNM